MRLPIPLSKTISPSWRSSSPDFGVALADVANVGCERGHFFQMGNTFPAEMRVRFVYSWDKKSRYQHVEQSALSFSKEACHQVGIFGQNTLAWHVHGRLRFGKTRCRQR